MAVCYSSNKRGMEKELVIGKSKTGKEGKVKHVIELVTPVGNWDSVPVGTPPKELPIMPCLPKTWKRK